VETSFRDPGGLDNVEDMPRLLLVAGAAVILMAMTGCVEPTPRVTAGPTASAPPVFASEEEALAAAEEAYAAYLAALDGALTNYDTARLRKTSTGQALKEALASVEEFKKDARVLVGSSSADSITLIQYSAAGDVSVYACLDVSATDVLGADGRSTVSEGRPLRYPMQIDAQIDDGEPLVISAEVWDGENFCE
jgi:hypothetical protein